MLHRVSAINAQKQPCGFFQRQLYYHHHHYYYFFLLFNYLLDTTVNAARICGNSGLEENWGQSYLTALTYLEDIILINKKF